MDLIAELTPVICLAAILGVVMSWIRQPPLLGYLLAGLLASSGRIGLSVHAGTIGSLGDLGIILLLFYLGLELSWRKMAPIAGRSFALAIAVAGLPFLVFYNFSLLAGLEAAVAIIVAFALAVNSTAIGVEALELHGGLNNRLGHLAVGANLIIDVLVISALAFLGLGAEGKLPAGQLLIRMAGFTALCATVGVLLVPRFVDAIHARPASRVLLPVVLIAFGLGVALAGHSFGVPISFGAFLAGAVAAEARCRDELEGFLHPVKELFIAFFFVAVGFQIRLESLWPALPVALGLSLVVLLVRWPAVAAGAFLLGEEGETSLSLAAILLPAGEFSLLLVSAAPLEPGLRERLLAVVVLMVFLTALIVEPALKGVPDLRRRLEARAPGAIRHLIVVVRGVLVPSVSPFPPPGNPVRGALRDLALTVTVIVGVGMGITAAAAYLDSITPSWIDVKLFGMGINIGFLLPALLIAWRRWVRVLDLTVGAPKTGGRGERIRLIQQATRASLTFLMLALLALALFPFLYAMADGRRTILLVVVGLGGVGLAFLFRNSVVRLHDLLETGMWGRGRQEPP